MNLSSSAVSVTRLMLLMLVRSSETSNRSNWQDSETVVWDSVEPNSWHAVSSWSRNVPKARRYAAATEVLQETPNGETREIMLLHGGESSHSDNRTWMYDTNSYSWEAVRQRSGPQGIIHHTLVTLCHTKILLFGGYQFQSTSRIGACSNETWAFDVKRKVWRLVDTFIRRKTSDVNNAHVTPRCRHTAAVVQYENTLCSCKESMVIYSGFYQSNHTWESNANDGFYDMWMLVCRSDVPLLYEWIPLHQRGPQLDHPGMVSTFNKTVLYVLGSSLNSSRVSNDPSSKTIFCWEVWSYCLAAPGWFKHGNCSKQKSFPGPLMYMRTSNHRYHVLISCCSDPVNAFDLIKETWSKPTTRYGHDVTSLSHIAAAKVGENVVAFGRRYRSRTTLNEVWKLVIWINDNGGALYFYWFRRSMPKPNPLKGRLFSVGGKMLAQNEIVLFSGLNVGGSYDQVPKYDNKIHRLDLITLKWSEEKHENNGPSFALFVTATVLLDSVLVVYGGVIPHEFSVCMDNVKISKSTWGYYNQWRVWVNYSSTELHPPARILHCAVARDTQTMMVYGGAEFISKDCSLQIEVRRDLWSFTLPSSKDPVDLSHQQSNAQWRLLDQSGPYDSYASSLAKINQTLYAYGGSGTTFSLLQILARASDVVTQRLKCSDRLWKYDLSSNVGWKEIVYSGSGPGSRCLHSANQFGNHMLIAGGCSPYAEVRLNIVTFFADYRCPVDSSTVGVWMYDPASVRWLRLTSQSAYHSSVIGPMSIIYGDLLLFFGGLPIESLASNEIPEDWNGFSVYKPACPPGTESRDIRQYMCSNCSVGFFATTSHSNCSRCPVGLTTLSEASTNIQMCSQCVPGYCGYGTCTVTLQGLAPNCNCQFGFTTDGDGRCTMATYYIAGSGFAAGVALLVLVAVLVAKFRKARKYHNVMLRNKEQELTELTNIWNIDCRELRLQERIDKDSPGGYGEVYKAEYKEIIVVVKKLQGIHQHLDRIELEFEREIEVMRTIRHPNIVLFLGGGRYHDDGCPFLVVEYMSRGSLASILKNEDIELEDSLKLRFTLDAAKGLEFLHSQRPPRVHRDLKSGNLLVSQRWVVKVADFGAARLVREEGVNQEAVRGEGPLDSEAPLLRADYQLSLCVGTPHWCAPEILDGHNYGTPADVYSFGIVMWEIWSRNVPYSDCAFHSVIDLKAAVLRGTRPTISRDEQHDYVNLMRDCWAGNSTIRPSFQEVVSRLEDLSEGDAVVNQEHNAE